MEMNLEGVMHNLFEKKQVYNCYFDIWEIILCLGVICFYMNGYWGLFQSGYLCVDF